MQEKVIERIKKIQEDLKNILNKRNINLSLSVGIAKKVNNQSLKQTLSNADIALYESKFKGKDTITLYQNNQSLKLKNK